MNTKVFHPEHGQGTLSKNLFESSSDIVLVEFNDGSIEVPKTELRIIFHS
tara:strand:- start:2824 stop:2973 length:150 start_codon:yes stop_codon:yes gene_type:complete